MLAEMEKVRLFPGKECQQVGYQQAACHRRTLFLKFALYTAAIFVVSRGCWAQAPGTKAPTAARGIEQLGLDKYPGLLPEFTHLAERLRNEVPFPTERKQSQVLPLLPEATLFYAAIPNYGEAIRQSLKIFREEREKNEALRNWWQSEPAKAGPKIEEFLKKLADVNGYLGDEIVISASANKQGPTMLVTAQITKPGLDEYLRKEAETEGKPWPGIHILTLKQFTAEDSEIKKGDVTVLVRPDFLVLSLDAEALRSFNIGIDRKSSEFANTEFGRRMAKEYAQGITSVGGLDLHGLLSLSPLPAAQHSRLKESGFANAKYAVWKRTSKEGESFSEGELSFDGPRRGAAAWIGMPRQLSSLDFVSPKALLVATAALNDPKLLFADVQELSGNPNAFATLEGFEKVLRVSLRDDVLQYLTGEVTVELDNLVSNEPVWRAILALNDTPPLRQTLDKLLAGLQVGAEHHNDGAVPYTTVQIPSQKPTKVHFAFVDGHLIIASNPEGLSDAAELHKSGQSLGRSKKLASSLPPGLTMRASGLIYQDAAAMMAMRLQQLGPSLTNILEQAQGTEATTMWLYGEDASIREASKSAAFDVGAALVVAAVATPSLFHSRVAANEASAVGFLRTINVAQLSYATTYPKKGYAATLAALRPGPSGSAASTEHADLVDAGLGCSGDGWCARSGYRFRISAGCDQDGCTSYVAAATPLDANSGTRSFCSREDGVIRWTAAGPLTRMVSAAECREWTALQ